MNLALSLPRANCLDPRPWSEASAAPYRDAVNIPAPELRRRGAELPPHGETVKVLACAYAADAVQVLSGMERPSVVIAGVPGLEPSGPMRLWEPTAWLAEILPQLGPGCALDVACGAGRDTAFLAAHGHNVLGVDCLDDAIETARELAERYAPGGAAAFLVCDVEDPEFEPPHSVDLVTIFRFLHRPLFERVQTWLKPGGSLLAETFTTTHRERHGKPRRDRLVLEPGELPKLAVGLEVVRYEEGWRGEAHTARLWARKAH